MSLSLFIGKRYARASRGKNLIFSIVSILGIAIGIMALIVTLAVMNGVTSEVRDKILSMTAHAEIISTTETLPKDTDITPFISHKKHVLTSAPFIEGQALIGIGQSYNGVLVKGIELDKEITVSDALLPLKEHLDALPAGAFNVIIGKVLANKLGVNIGDKITVVVPKTTATAAGILPRIKRFSVSEIFESGHYLYDSGLILININDAAKLFQRGQGIDGFQLKLDDLFAAQALVSELNDELPISMYAFDWTQQNKAYFDAVKTEKAMMFFILMMILVVAVFNILSTLIVVVSDKRRDIAILRTLGASPSVIMRIFMIQGIALGIMGTLVGVLGGIFIASQVPNMLAFAEAKFGFRLPAELYFISELHPKIDSDLLLLIAASALLLSFLATLYPAYKASRVQPARALAYE